MSWQEIIASTASALAILSVMVLTLRYLYAQTDALNAASDARTTDLKDSITTETNKTHTYLQSLNSPVWGTN